jgi:hypothetical protein
MIVYTFAKDADISVEEVCSAFPTVEIHNIYFNEFRNTFIFREGTRIYFDCEEDATAFRLKFGI